MSRLNPYKSSSKFATSAFFTALLIAGCGGGGGGSISTADPLTKGLIHEWKFDGDANDSIGTLNGTTVGAVTYASAQIGQGIVLDGNTMGVTLPAVADMQFQASFTVSAWAKLNSYPSGGRQWDTIAFDGDDRGGNDPWYLSVNPGGLLEFQIDGAAFPASPGALDHAFPLNQMTLVTATYDLPSGTMTLYLNGAQVEQLTGNKTLTPVVPLDSGSQPGTGIGNVNAFPSSAFNFAWDGTIDDVRIYSRALSASEVLKLYNRGLAGM